MILPKKAPLLEGGEERFRPVDPSIRSDLHLAPPPKKGFQVPVFMLLRSWRGGTKSIITCRLALGIACCVVRSGTQQFVTP